MKRVILIALSLLMLNCTAWAQSKKEQIATLQHVVDSLNQNITTLNSKNGALTRQLNDSTRACKNLRSNLTTAKKESSTLQSKLNTANAQVAKLESELNSNKVRIGRTTMENIVITDYLSKYDVRVWDCEGWSMTLDGTYRFYCIDGGELGVFCQLNDQGQEEYTHFCAYSFNGGASSGANAFYYSSDGSLLVFWAGDPEAEVDPQMNINGEECRFKILKHEEKSYDY